MKHLYETRVLIIILMLTAVGCSTVLTPDEQSATIDSFVHIIAIDDIDPESPFHVRLSPGPHELLIEYRTFLVTYRCRLRFDAQAGMRYELVDHSNPQPVALYRMKRVNWMFTNRLKPILPEHCDEIKPAQ